MWHQDEEGATSKYPGRKVIIDEKGRSLMVAQFHARNAPSK